MPVILLSPTTTGPAYSWVEPSGTVHALSGNDNYNVLVGERGIYLPPIAFQEEQLPTDRGARLLYTSTKPRIVDVPLLIKDVTPAALDARVRLLLYWLDPYRGDGKLRVTAPDGAVRELVCRYQSGLEGDKNPSSAGATHYSCVLSFKAWSPLWQDTADATIQYWNSSYSFVNNGDLELWPVWRIQQNSTNPAIITNTTTGKLIRLNRATPGGQYVDINTGPLFKTVKDQSGVNLFGYLSDDSSLFPMIVGTNTITVSGVGAGGTEGLILTTRQRYFSP